MPFFDMGIDRLREYRPEVRCAADFEEFWRDVLAREMARPLQPQVERIDAPLRGMEFYDVSWTGFGGQRVRGWLRLPVHREERIPAVVQYRGYSGGRGYAHADMMFAVAGYAHFVIDARGQGWKHPAPVPGLPDHDAAAGEVAIPGMMTRGILDRDSYYYLRLFVDSVRLLELAGQDERVDPERIALSGNSQGGGMAIAVAGLASLAGLPLAASMSSVPFLCHYGRAVGLTDKAPYQEIASFLAGNPQFEDQAFHTLSYFDGVNFARHAAVPTLFSVGLMDQVCPPSTVYAAFNAWGHDDKQIEVYRWNGHEGGGDHHTWKSLAWLQEKGF